jgi:type I restriction enzyme, S subunit
MSDNIIEMGDAPLEIIDGDRGKNYPNQNELLDEGHCFFLSAANVTKDGFSFDARQFITEEKDNALRKGKVQRNDVILTTRGTLGNVAFYSDNIPFEHVRINSGMVTIKTDPDKLSARYLYYFLKSSSFQSQVKALQSGAAQPQLPIRDIKKIKIRVPELSVQKGIEQFIGAYDDLIENNRRRAALLEEAARLLYREWFVYLRFPGHEHAKIVDGVPEGWERRTLGDHCPFNYGKALKADIRVDGDVDVFGSSGIVGSHNQKLVDGSAIIVGRKGNVGSIFWAHKPFWPIDTVYYIAPENSDLFTYYALKNAQFISTDVAVPGLNRNYAHSRQILLPDNNLLADFLERVTPMHEQCRLLERAATELARARDLLLPRLMDGRIEV